MTIAFAIDAHTAIAVPYIPNWLKAKMSFISNIWRYFKRKLLINIQIETKWDHIVKIIEKVEQHIETNSLFVLF